MPRFQPLTILLLLGMACRTEAPDKEDIGPLIDLYLDADGDSYGDEFMHVRLREGGALLSTIAGDCDDRYDFIHPGAPELCNERDDDCDGMVDEPPVDDPTTEACACDDGIDNDSDGLIDCEDANCAEHEHCSESDCGDLLDNDSDGLTDCEDDDCWGPECHTGPIRARAMGGRAVTRVHHWREWFRAASHSTSHMDQRSHIQTNLYLYSVWGTVQTDDLTCAWSFPFATAQSTINRNTRYASSRHWGRLNLGEIQREDFNVHGGCLLNSPWFLPAVVRHGALGNTTTPGLFWTTFQWYALTGAGSPRPWFEYTTSWTSRHDDGYNESYLRVIESLRGSSFSETIGSASTYVVDPGKAPGPAPMDP